MIRPRRPQPSLPWCFFPRTPKTRIAGLVFDPVPEPKPGPEPNVNTAKGSQAAPGPPAPKTSISVVEAASPVAVVHHSTPAAVSIHEEILEEKSPSPKEEL